MDEIKTKRPYAIGVDLGGTNLRAALVDADGQILIQRQGRTAWDTATFSNLEAVLPGLVRLVGELLAAPGVDPQAIAGIGAGVTGHINRQGEFIGGKGPPQGYARKIPVKASLSKAFAGQFPVWVENDSKAAAWGEYLFGAGRGVQSMVALTIGTGIGGGIVLDGRLLHGVQGLAGHVGFMTIDLHGERGPSGVLGYLEQYASGTGIAQAAQKALTSEPPGRLSILATGDPAAVIGERVFAAARQGDPLAEQVIRRAAFALGIGICNLLHVFNPELVVLGGGVAEQGDFFLEQVRQTVAEHALVNFNRTPLRLAELGDRAGVIGAAALCWQ